MKPPFGNLAKFKSASNNPALAAQAKFQEGLALHQKGQLAQAQALYQQVLKTHPKHFDALHLLGVIAGQTSNPLQAIELIGRAIAINPDNAAFHSNRGNALKELKRFAEALQSYERALKLKPDYVDALYNRANALKELKRFAEALQSYERALKVKPDYVDALYNRANALQELRRPDEALESYERVLKLKPDYAEAHSNRGLTLQQLKRLDEALESYERALELKPDYAEAHSNRGVTLQQLKRLDEALESYERALELKPDYAEALCNRGNALQELNRLDEALQSYEHALKVKPDYVKALSDRGATLQELKRLDEALQSSECALKVKPDYADALYNRGNALQELNRLDEALQSYDCALKIKPDYVKAHSNRGLTLQQLKRLDEALESYERALEFKPDFAEALYNRGNALQELNRLDEALQSYERALEFKPDSAEALHNRGNALQELKRLDEALESYGCALKVKPDYEFLYGTWLHTKMHLCDWSDAESQLTELFHRIQQNEKATQAFPVLALTSSLPLQRKAAEILVNDKHAASFQLPAILKRARHGKIRIGYYSADFRNHPVSYLTAELFESHDRAKVEVIAFSFGSHSNDEMRQRLIPAFDKFIDVRNQSDKEVAQLSRNLEIDVAVDLGGFTQDCRPGIFAMRVAPIQVSYIGYLGTMGAQYMDYLIADKTIIPSESQSYYSEKIVYLPSFQANDSKRRISDRIFIRGELGLPEEGFIFCCFNNNYKITPSTFDGWMRILTRVEGSVLFLYADNELAVNNLKKEAGLRGVEPGRLIFGRRLPMPEYLARFRSADLFLDTLPYNAGATASDALWAGLPVLTCMGEAFASRVAASLLNAIDLPELITTTQEQYETLAVQLATNPERLSRIKQKLERNRLTMPLFDTVLFTKHIEAAYTQMYERYQADLPLGHIYVSQ